MANKIIFTVVGGVILIVAAVFIVHQKSREIVLVPTPSPSETLVSKSGQMLFVGDIMLSRSVGDLIAQKNDYRWPFEQIADFTRNADLTFANLETPVSTRGIKVGSVYSFRSDPKTLEGLTYAGFDIVSVANNHAWDYGRDAFVDTLDHLREVNISSVGGGHNEKEAHTGIVRDVAGTKVGFLAYTNLLPKSLAAQGEFPGIAIYDEAQMVDDIQQLKTHADIIVVSFHWGEEYHPIHNALQEGIAHKAIDAGADLIIGHHPHVPEDIEKYKDKYIVYSLGNFIFDQNWSAETMKGLAVRVLLKDGKIDKLEQIPIHITTEYQATL